MLNYLRSYLIRHLLNIEQRNYRYVHQISPSSIKLNSTMKTLIANHQYKEALDLFEKKLSIHTDATFVLALKASTKLSDHQRGITIHQQLPLKSLKNLHIQTALIHFYMQSHRVNDAEQIFSTVEKENLFIYGAMLKGYLSNNMPEKVFELYKKISIKLDTVIMTIFFNACAKICDDHAIQIGNDAFEKLPKSFLENPNLIRTIIDMFMKFHNVERAEYLFKQMKKIDSSIYGIMMNGYKMNDQPRPYHVEYTSSRPITEVKQRRARLVLGWVTAWEYRVS
ncbi:unnamed protein product [Adineta ricciae]|uniref:Uncharacterized protein n=2 Tax=Adineta ricciae TaxID=249248 RepID=A0A815TME6_ADIRI|nr:unnamed protein product [Adineta ricciae]